jgi:hypothetical protein
MIWAKGLVPAKNIGPLRPGSFGLGSEAASKYRIPVWFWALALRAK